jgi:Ca2+-binding EF-hand superfamily protein
LRVFLRHSARSNGTPQTSPAEARGSSSSPPETPQSRSSPPAAPACRSVASRIKDLCQEERTLFGDAIFDLIDTEDTNVIEFGEFVQAVCTFVMFQPVDILRFSFFIFDKDKNGYIDKDELELFVNTLHNGGVAGNVMNALHTIDFNGDGKFDFQEFSALHAKFPTVLYPAFRLQTQMQMYVMGTSWWERKKAKIAMQKEAEMFVLEKSGQISVMKAERERRRIVRKQMGLINYYAAGLSLAKGNAIKKRDYLERQIPIPTYKIVKGEVVLTLPEPVVLPGDDDFARQMEGEQHDFDPNQRTGRSALSG